MGSPSKVDLALPAFMLPVNLTISKIGPDSDALRESAPRSLGFALIGSAAEWLGEIGSHDVHEFFILRKFRRRGVGKTAPLIPVLFRQKSRILFRPAIWATRTTGSELRQMPAYQE